jgi:flagellar basal body P-ring formation protein FlgA
MALHRLAPGVAIYVFAALVNVMPAPAEMPDQLVVTVRPRAAVGPRTIRVGDVADLAGGSPALREAVAALDLTDAGAARAGITIKRQQVAFRIRLAEVPSSLFRVDGAEESLVERQRCSVPEADVIAATKEAILKLMPWGADDVSIQLVQPVAVQLVVDAPRAEVLIKAESHSGTTPLGRIQMDVSLWADGVRQLAFPVYLDVRLYQKVAVALHKIEKGEALNEVNVSFDRRPVERLRDYLTSPEALAGKRARQALLPGRVLTAIDAEDDGHEAATPPLVRRGEAVKLLVRLGPVNVMASGEALQDGRAGQSVRVRNTDSKQVVLGRVTERSLVEVDP